MAGHQQIAVLPSTNRFIDPEQLRALNSAKDEAALQKLGGAAGLATTLGSNLEQGLDDNGVAEHRSSFGENVMPQKPSPAFWSLVADAAKDPMIIVLLIVSAISIVLGAAVPEQRAHKGWSEGIAVFFTAIIVICVAAGQDWSKERQFQKLNALKDVIPAKVKRNGKQVQVSSEEVVVGDLLFMDAGDKVIADGIVVSSQGLVIDEASLTGESDPIKKEAGGDVWVRSGTTVNEGSGVVLVTAVGKDSEWGRTLALVADAGDDETPLQVQLGHLAGLISKAGVSVAILCFLVLLIQWLVVTGGGNSSSISTGPLQFLLYSVTIVVVSVPEGLPLAVTLTLAYSMKKMMKDNNFVRVLAACETMGGATAICSDKTGTLTENRMTVTEGWFCGTSHKQVPTSDQMSAFALQLLANNSALNSKAFLVDQANGTIDFVGNRTECALLVLVRNMGLNYVDIREKLTGDVVKQYFFTSARKMAGVLVRDASAPGGLRYYNKGAAEWVLKKCVATLSADGQQEALSEERREQLLGVVTDMAKRGLRCICMTYRDYAESDRASWDDPNTVDEGLVAYAIVGIKDPVRKEVPDAVSTCQKAGIVVRMVTGDNIHTAQHIARECGILTDDSISMEGPTFRTMDPEELGPLLPKLRVLARSSPEDKLTLVNMLKTRCGDVVAVTGDGTNDAPALKESDVGLAMGIAGTEVAKEAADIIILDDNFSSIVMSVLWGRSVGMNIRKFLVFQLSINLVAMISAFVGAVYGGVPPLSVLQLLWVNMIMDTLAALALATEEPYKELLDDTPQGRDSPIISGYMYLHILTGSCYKLFWLFLCLYGLPVLIDRYQVLDKDTFYQGPDCPEILSEHGWNATAIPTLCNLMGSCGFPRGGDTRQTPECSLYSVWQPSAVPDNMAQAVCSGANKCPLYDDLKKAMKRMDKEWDYALLDSYKPALSVLFNQFILAQVANAFLSRRIKLELNVFEGVLKGPIFLGIMAFITVMQIIIMQTPLGYVFKVQPLDGPEWGACIAIGLGAIPFSLAVRVVARLLLPFVERSACVGWMRRRSAEKSEKARQERIAKEAELSGSAADSVVAVKVV